MKDAVPDSPQDFAFKLKGASSKRFTLDDDKDPERSNTRTFRRLEPGTYRVTEKPTSGWWLTQLVCDTGERIDLAKRRVRIRLTVDEHVTCTFTNQPVTGGGRRPRPAARGAITIIKDAVPDGPEVFRFSSTVSSYPQFFLDDDPKTVRPNSITIAGLRPDTFDVGETVPADWELAHRGCTVVGANGSTWNRRGSARIRIKLRAGDHVVCTFRNERFGTMQVAKVAVPPGGAPSFPFEFQFPGGTFPFAVTPGIIANRFTYPPGKYAFVEGAVPGWKLDDIKCTTGEQPNTARKRVDIKLAPGETVVCTFTNTKGAVDDQEEPGTLTVVKNEIPDDGQDFLFTVTPDVATTPFRLDDDRDGTLPNGQTFSMTPGTYTINELAAEGWDTSVSCSDGTKAGGRSIDVTVKANTNLVCTFTNTKPGEFGAVLTVVKDARPNSPEDFLFTITPRIAISPFRLDDDAADPMFLHGRVFDVAPGTYSITELDPTGEWETNVSCSNGVSAAGRTVEVALAPDEHVLCTFTNLKPDEAGAKLTILKDARPDSGEKFAFTVTPRVAVTPFRLIDDGSRSGSAAQGFDVAPGTYTITEAAVEGWDTSIFCTSGETASGRSIEITLELNEDVVCRFTNTKPGEGGATLTVVKDAQPDSGQDFGFTITPRVALTLFRLDDDQDATHPSSRTFDAAPGTYTIAEEGASGWETSVVCDNGATGSGRSVEVTLEADQEVTCTFTNRRPEEAGSITIVEDVKPDDENMFNSQDFHYLVRSHDRTSEEPGYLYEQFDLDDEADATLPNTRRFTDLLPGTYSLEQPAASAYPAQTAFPLSGISCDTGEQGVTDALGPSGIVDVTLDPGEHITCTFTNQRLPGRLRIGVLWDWNVIADPVFNFTTSGPGLHPFSFDVLSPRTTIDFEGLDAVSYTITQAPPSFSVPAGTVRLFRITCETVISDSFAPGAGLQLATFDVASGRLDLIVRPFEDNYCIFWNELVTTDSAGGTVPSELVALNGAGALVSSIGPGPGREIAGTFDQSGINGPRAVVSPDATTAYVARRPDGASRCETEIVRVSLADAAAEVVAANAASPALSPDGGRLAYVALSSGTDGCAGTLEVRDLASGEERAFPIDQGVARGGLVWAPDGRRLAFDRADDAIVIFDTEAAEGPAAGIELRPEAKAGRGRAWSVVGFVGDDTLLVQARCTRGATCPGKTRLVTIDLADPERAHSAASLPRRVHDVVVDATGGIVVYVRGAGPASAGHLEWIPLGAGDPRPSVIAEDIIGAALLGATTQPGGP